MFNHHVLQALVPALCQQLVGSTLVQAFSQRREELVLAFERKEESLWLRAALGDEQPYLDFPESYQRARSNSADVLAPALGLVVQQGGVYAHERAFYLQGAQGLLVFKLFGRRGNVLWYASGQGSPVLFRSSLKNDLELDPATLHRHWVLGEEQCSSPQPSAALPTLGPVLGQHLLGQGYATARPSQRLQLLQGLLASMHGLHVCSVQGQLHLLPLPLGQVLESPAQPLQAANRYVHLLHGTWGLQQQKDAIARQLQATIAKTEAYLAKTQLQMEQLQQGLQPNQEADLIMANLHAIPPGAEQVQLFDFYHQQHITLRLNASLSAQKNAEQRYRKAKNRNLQLAALQANLQARSQALAQHRSLLHQLPALADHRSLKAWQRANGLAPQQVQQQQASLPYTLHHHMGWEILVGRNAAANDELTFRTAHKEDIWLHARDVAGSHVIIRQRPGSSVPAPVLQHAASLAAGHSRRASEGLCPVIYTPRKHVRKPRGAAPGQVQVLREQVLLVPPLRG